MKILKFSTAAIIVISLFFTSCEEFGFCIRGDGNIVTETIEIADFSAIELIGADDVIITYGETQEVTATGDQNMIDRLKTNVTGDTWEVRLENGCHIDYQLTIFITMADIESIGILGSGDVLVNDFTNGGDLDLSITGSGDIELNQFANCPKLTADITGSGDIELQGEFPDLETLDVSIIGSGDFIGYPADATEAYIEVIGSGNCYVTALDLLDVSISGSGDVFYKGNPLVDLHVTGSGSVISRN
ncbi:head GIN domain-containing protein [Bacteroidota bacterium]